MTNNPAFLVYSASMVVLCLNILALWGYSGSARARSKTTPNPEDVATVSRGASVEAVDPPQVARVLRAHRNAADNILPFAILGLLFVMWGGSVTLTAVFCGVFVVARLAHTLVYLGGKQPWRTIFFTIGGLDTGVMMVMLVKQLIASS